MYKSKDIIEESKIEIFENDELVAFIPYQESDVTIRIETPKLLKEDFVVTVKFHEFTALTMRNKQKEFLSKFTNPQAEVSFEMVADFGNGEKKHIKI